MQTQEYSLANMLLLLSPAWLEGRSSSYFSSAQIIFNALSLLQNGEQYLHVKKEEERHAVMKVRNKIKRLSS